MPGGYGKKKKGQDAGFKTQLLISPELRDFFGGRERISRPMMTKLTWAYFKKEGVLNKNDKRYVLCDATLKALTGLDTFKASNFMQFFNKHIVKLDKPEQVYGHVEGDEEEGEEGDVKGLDGQGPERGEKEKAGAKGKPTAAGEGGDYEMEEADEEGAGGGGKELTAGEEEEGGADATP